MPFLALVKRLAKNALSSTDERIAEYCAAFKQLRSTFSDKRLLETRIIVSRVMADIGAIGKSSHTAMDCR